MWTLKKRGQCHQRHIVLHYHIFKNAGTTIVSILERNFRRRFAALESDHFNSPLSNAVLLEFLNNHPKIQAVSSHQLVPPPPDSPTYKFHRILFLRHPLARLSSIYDFSRRTAVTDDPLTQEAKKRSTSEFMRYVMEEHAHQASNPQVTFLGSRNRAPDESLMDAAFRVARQSAILGSAELFDVSAVQAEYVLSPMFGPVNFGYVAQNVSSMAPRALDVHLAQFREACGDDIFDRLLEANAADLQLLQLVEQEIWRRFREIPGHDQRLANFQFWRSTLHPTSVRGVLASNHPHDFVHYANVGNN